MCTGKAIPGGEAYLYADTTPGLETYLQRVVRQLRVFHGNSSGYTYCINPLAKQDARVAFVGGMQNVGPVIGYQLHHRSEKVLSVKGDEAGRNRLTNQGDGAYFGSMEYDAVVERGAGAIPNALLNKQSDSQLVLICTKCSGSLFKMEKDVVVCIGQGLDGERCTGRGTKDIVSTNSSRTLGLIAHINNSIGISMTLPVSTVGVTAGAGAGAGAGVVSSEF